MPAGIFTNESVSYEKARRFLVANFKVRGILNLGKDAFMATGIKTVLLLLEKRPESISIVGKEELTRAELKDLMESERTLVAWMGQGQEEKNFLGYAFSNRRGYVGIQIYERSSLFATDGALKEIQSLDVKVPFLDELMRLSFDDDHSIEDLIVEAKASLESLPEALIHDLKPVYSNLRIVSTSDLVELDQPGFRINTRAADLDSTNRFDFESAGLDFVTVGSLLAENQISITSGKRPKGGVARNRSGIISLGGEHIDERIGRIDISKPKYVPNTFLNDERSSDMAIRTGDLLVCKDGARSGKVALATQQDFVGSDPVLINEHLLRVRALDEIHRSQLEVAFLFFFSREGRAELDSAIAGTGQGGISVSRLQKVRVPVLDSDLAASIFKEYESNTLEQGFSFHDLVMRFAQ